MTLSCNHTKKEGINCCGDCGADLTLTQEEIDARDEFLPLFEKSIISKLPGDNTNSAVNRNVLDHFLSKNALTLAYKLARVAYKIEREDETEIEKKDILLEIEKEKLRILKEIRDDIYG